MNQRERELRDGGSRVERERGNKSMVISSIH